MPAVALVKILMDEDVLDGLDVVEIEVSPSRQDAIVVV